MYGGTAKTYCTWKQLGEPFQVNKVYYIDVEHPVTHASKRVRWYCDKAHAALMPQKEKTFQGKAFGFEDETSTVLVIREADLTQAEIEGLFHYNWKNSDGTHYWRNGRFFGSGTIYSSSWYAPAGTPIPPIAKQNKVFSVTWQQFVREGRRIAMHDFEEEKGFWFEEVAL